MKATRCSVFETTTIFTTHDPILRIWSAANSDVYRKGFFLVWCWTMGYKGRKGVFHEARSGRELGIAYSWLLHLWNHFFIF